MMKTFSTIFIRFFPGSPFTYKRLFPQDNTNSIMFCYFPQVKGEKTKEMISNKDPIVLTQIFFVVRVLPKLEKRVVHILHPEEMEFKGGIFH
ncbi:MAG TPA: hypothetical protein VIK89_13635 [Cytophagaceae bacterium]